MTALARATVLTVEDDPFVRADIRLVLEEAGFDVCADAADGLSAVDLAREHTPDVILLDLGLPRLDGVEAARRILAERDVPIVALTGRSRALVDRALEAGAFGYVAKPFHEEEIVDALHDAIATHRRSRRPPERDESLRALQELLGSVGYPTDWAVELEERAWRAGRVWRRQS
jgi:two-component system, response regulator PdtaR